MNYDLETIRSQFPALALTDKGQPRVYLDNPAGTQVPVQVIQRMSDYLIHCNSNQGGTFKTSIESDLILEEAHQAMADLLNAGSSSEIIFGANMTTLTYAISRSLGKRFQKGGALLLTRMDHDGNVAPWLQLAEDLGLEVRWLEFEPTNFQPQILRQLQPGGDITVMIHPCQQQGSAFLKTFSQRTRYGISQRGHVGAEDDFRRTSGIQ